jgi:uncharacterized protein YutE (UPF0331/DUF86 family)
MPTEIELRCETIEECYEFTLSYAARGLSTSEDSDLGRQIRHNLTRAVEAMADLKACCGAAIDKEGLAPREKYEAFFAVLARDAQSSIAAMELVLAQPVISSQLIDNLNACIHLRALLTDLFLITEILQLRQTPAESLASANTQADAPS